MDPLNVLAKFEICSFTRSVWDNRGYAKKLGSPWIRPRCLFSTIFHGLLFGWTLTVIVLAKFEVCGFTSSRDNSDWSFGWGANPQSWGRGGRRRSGMVPFERAKVSSYRLPIVTYSLSLRVSEILPLLCSRTPFFPTPPLVSPKFPHVPLGIGGCPYGYEERRCWSVQLVSKTFNLCDPDPPTLQTDGRTDRWTDNMRSQYRALHYSASRGKKSHCTDWCYL